MKRKLLVFSFVLIIAGVALTGCGGGGSPMTAELYYDTTVDNTIIGSLGGYSSPTTIDICVIFDSTKFGTYAHGGRITAVALFNSDATDFAYIPEVYEANPGSSPNPSAPISRNAVPTVITSRQWATITLDTPVTIDSSKEYWIGYRTSVNSSSQYPLASGLETSYGNSRIYTYGDLDFGLVAYNFLVHAIVNKP